MLKIKRRLRNLVWMFSKVRKDLKFWKTVLWNLFFQIIIAYAKNLHNYKWFHYESFNFLDWFAQQDAFNTEIEDMEKEELNKCLRKFYMAARKHNRGYNQATLTSITATWFCKYFCACFCIMVSFWNVEITSCVYTKTIILFNLGEKWPNIDLDIDLLIVKYNFLK